MSSRHQAGIFHEPGASPPACYRLVLLNATPRAKRAALRKALGRITDMLTELRAGKVRDLTGQPGDEVRASAAQFDGLKGLIGYGRRLFDGRRHRPTLARAGDRPDYLAYLPTDRPFPGIAWAERATRDGEADFAIQLTADGQAPVNCAAVEIWKLIADERLPLRVVASFDGFARPDGRGWLDFHDGVSNMPSDQRAKALTAVGEPEWMAGGTYMAFLRFAVDLAAWRSLERGAQELLIGRDKRSGAALVSTERGRDGRARPVAAPPRSGAGARRDPDWIDPPQTTDPLLEASHIHRANQSRASTSAPAALRMFRQGYDFLDGIDGEGPALGLNFVSFQSDLAVLQHVLHLPGWLGDVNFGGPSRPRRGEPKPLALVELLAGGLYAVPPRADPFPGARSLFGRR